MSAIVTGQSVIDFSPFRELVSYKFKLLTGQVLMSPIKGVLKSGFPHLSLAYCTLLTLAIN